MGVALTERQKLRRQMTAAAGKKESVSFSLFLEDIASSASCATQEDADIAILDCSGKGEGKRLVERSPGR